MPLDADYRMLRTASMGRRAQVLARRLYASLPRGYRLAMTFIRLGASAPEVEAFCRVVYATFILAGIEGLPPVRGIPASEMGKKYPRVDRLAKMLPQGYGMERLGKKVQQVLFALNVPLNKHDDVLQTFLLSFLSGNSGLDPSKSLDQAEAFVLGRLRWRARDDGRQERTRAKDRPRFVHDDEEHPVIPQIEDDRSFAEFEKAVSHHYMDQLTTHLDRQFQDSVGRGVIPQYFRLVDEGYSDKEILTGNDGEPIIEGMTGRKSPTNWNTFKKQYLYPAIVDYFEKHPPNDAYEQGRYDQEDLHAVNA